jgi:hypothetical protein
MVVRLIALVASVLLGFVFPAPLVLLAAGILQGNPHTVFERTFGEPNLLLAYKFASPFAMVFALSLAGFGFTQCRRTDRVPRHLWWHTGFLFLGATFGSASLLAFQVAFGGSLVSIADVLGLIVLGAAAGALCALPVSTLWYYVVRRKIRIEHERADDPAPALPS